MEDTGCPALAVTDDSTVPEARFGVGLIWTAWGAVPCDTGDGTLSDRVDTVGNWTTAEGLTSSGTGVGGGTLEWT